MGNLPLVASLTQKIGVKAGMRTVFVGSSGIPRSIKRGILGSIQVDERTELSGEFDYIHLFARSKTELSDLLRKLKDHLAVGGMLWISWPKAGQLGTDLNQKAIFVIGYDAGMVESKAIALDNVWSAMRFTLPKPGKEYHNAAYEAYLQARTESRRSQ